MINVRRKSSAVFVLLMFSISVVAIAPRLGLSVPQAHAVTPKALINGDTVSGSPSIEEQQATALDFAGLLSSRTGIYFDMSCFDNGQGLSTLNMLSVGASSWTENTSPPCGGSVSLIASNPAFADLNSGDLQGWFCSDHETFPQFRD